MLKGAKLLLAQHRGLSGGEGFCVKRRAVRSHKSGNSRAYDVSSDFKLKAPQNGVVEERAALNHDVFPQLVRIGGAG